MMKMMKLKMTVIKNWAEEEVEDEVGCEEEREEELQRKKRNKDCCENDHT
jgi:hypothetical protein